jgi:hypothetical protein
MWVPSGDSTRRSRVGSGEKCPQCPAFCSIFGAAERVEYSSLGTPVKQMEATVRCAWDYSGTGSSFAAESSVQCGIVPRDEDDGTRATPFSSVNCIACRQAGRHPFRSCGHQRMGCPMSRLQQLTVAVVASLVVAGCAPAIVVSSHVDRDLSLSKYRSFNWGPADALPIGDPRLDNDPYFKDRVQGAVEKQLAARGIELSRAGTADLLIHYHANIRDRIDVDRIDRDRGYCDSEDCPPATIRYEAGTLVIDFIDARTNRLIWRGWAQHSVEDMLHDPDRMATTINEAVTRMMERLPL